MKRWLIMLSLLLALGLSFMAPFSAGAQPIRGTRVQYYVAPYGYRVRRYYYVISPYGYRVRRYYYVYANPHGYRHRHHFYRYHR